MIDFESLSIIGLVLLVAEILGLASAAHAVMKAKTSQGAIAWAIFLITFPLIILPAYWIFGRSRFHGYVRLRRSDNAQIRHILEALLKQAPRFRAALDGERRRFEVLESLAAMPFTKSNGLELLVDGDATFTAIFEAIERAESYILVQFFIVRDDTVGRDLAARLARKAADGVRVYFLYDEIGCHGLPGRYVRALTAAGVQMRPFATTRGWGNRFQLNFRNHRKVVVVDGREAYIGGHNVGDEYLGRKEKVGAWRDTHARLTGPSVQCIQIGFLEDWYWATHDVPEMTWAPTASSAGDQRVLVLPTGPADDMETCSLFFVHAIHAARQRIWIASPYFVPDAQVVSALQLAALRGVDVRVMLPQRADHLLVYLAGFSYVEETEPAGVKIYRYRPGFLHQKVLLVDDDLAAVGTANLDNRSFSLNFELTVASVDRDACAALHAMLADDFDRCDLTTSDDLAARSLAFRVAVRVARLFSPLL